MCPRVSYKKKYEFFLSLNKGIHLKVRTRGSGSSTLVFHHQYRLGLMSATYRKTIFTFVLNVRDVVRTTGIASWPIVPSHNSKLIE
jgi:hypothetical protein